MRSRRTGGTGNIRPPNPAGISGLRAFKLHSSDASAAYGTNDPAKSDGYSSAATPQIRRRACRLRPITVYVDAPDRLFKSRIPNRLRFRCGERRCWWSNDDTHHPPHTARMTVIFVPACQQIRRPLAAGHDLVVDRNCDSVSDDTPPASTVPASDQFHLRQFRRVSD